MREPVEPVKPGEEYASSLSWRDEDAAFRPGTRVEATDGPLGVLRERRADPSSDQVAIRVETQDGELVVPERLIRETHGDTIYLSLPAADVRAQSEYTLARDDSDRR